MSDQIKQIAERLRGLRDVLELTSQEVAESCQLTVEKEQGNVEPEPQIPGQIERPGTHYMEIRSDEEQPGFYFWSPAPVRS